MEFSFRCICGLSSRLEYKYSRLVMSANKECELPAADSCALAEGEEPDDDVVYAQKPSLLGKLRAIATKVCVFFLKAGCCRETFILKSCNQLIICVMMCVKSEQGETSESVLLNSSQSDRWVLGWTVTKRRFNDG